MYLPYGFLFSGELLCEQGAGPCASATTGPDSGAGVIKILDWRASVRKAAGGAVHEMLVQMVAAADLITAYKIGVISL